VADLEPTHPESDPKIQLQSNTENPIGLIRIEVGDLGGAQREQLLPLEDGAENGRVLVPLVKRRRSLGVESLALVVSVGLDAVVVDADALVGVPDGDVEGEVVVERVVGGGEVELGERGVGDAELHLVGAEEEPEDEDNQGHDDEEREEDLEDEAQKATEEAAATAAPTFRSHAL